MRASGYLTYDLDALIEWFVGGEDPLELGRERLSSAIQEHCRCMVTKEISRKLDLRLDSERDILEEAVTGSLERTWMVLCRAHRQGDDGFLKSSASSLVRSIAQKSLADQFRSRMPEGYKLSCRISYILDKHAHTFGFIRRLCWPGKTASYDLITDVPRACQSEPWSAQAFLQEMLGPISVEEVTLPELLRKVIMWHGRPMSKSEILSCMRELLVPSDMLPHSDSLSDQPDTLARASDFDEVEWADDARTSLKWLWNEIAQLPDEQCWSILLRMQTEGLEAIAIHVGYEAIAVRMGIEEEQVAELIGCLPVDFEAIADRLGLSSQQARSRRARGWNRIERRYAGWRRESGKELGLMSRWMSLLDRVGGGSESVLESS